MEYYLTKLTYKVDFLEDAKVITQLVKASSKEGARIATGKEALKSLAKRQILEIHVMDTIFED